jgi:hypothetical protein
VFLIRVVEVSLVGLSHHRHLCLHSQFLFLVFFISVYLRILVNLARNRCGFCFCCQFVEFSTFNLARICCRIVQNENTQTRLGTSVDSRLLQLISSHFRSRTSALHWFELSRSLFLSHRLKENFVFHFSLLILVGLSMQ